MERIEILRKMRKCSAILLSMLLLCGLVVTDAAVTLPLVYEAFAEQGESIAETQTPAEFQEPMEPEPQPTVMPESEPEPEAAPETAPVPEPEAAPETAPVPEPEAAPETAPVPEPEVAPETAPVPEPEVTPEPEEPIETANPPVEEGTLQEEAPEDPDGLGEEEVEDGSPLEPGHAALGDFATPSAAAGGTLAFAVPIRFTRGDLILDSNAGEDGGLIAYGSGIRFDQSLTIHLQEMSVTIDSTQAEDCPLATEALGARQMIVTGGENLGYAAFENLAVPEDASPGTYPLRLTAAWSEAGGETHSSALTIDIEISLAKGDVSLGEYETPTGIAGGTLTLAIPIRFTRGDLIFDSNAGENGGIIPYEEGQALTGYDQSIAEALEILSVSIAGGQADGYPLLPEVSLESRELLSGKKNHGYAVFENMPVREDALPGDYTVQLSVTWLDAGGLEQSKILAAPLQLATMLLWDDGNPIVFNFDQLREAIVTHGFEKVYLGWGETEEGYEELNNGQIEFTDDQGIQVNHNLTIVGTDPRSGKRVTLTDWNNLSMGSTIRAVSSGLTLRLEDATVIGRNYYGILFGGINLAPVIEFSGVTYTGAQVTCNYGANSRVSFTNCNIAITYQEVAEAAQVDFYGTNTISHPVAIDSVVWLNGSPNKLTVHSGANVTVNSTTYFIYNAESVADVTIDGSLNLTTSGAFGCMMFAAQYMNSCRVQGTLTIAQNNAEYASLRAKNLTVTGTLDIARQAGPYPCIAFPAGSTANFLSPVRVSLSNPGGVVMRNFEGMSQVSITTQAMNLWRDDTKHIWNDDKTSVFTVSATLNTSGAASASSTLQGNTGVALGAQTLNSTNWDPSAATRLLLGPYSLSIDSDTVYPGSTMIRGSAPGTVTVREYNRANGVLGTMIQSKSAAGDGSYQTGSDWNPIASNDSRVYVMSVQNDLEAHVYADCVETCFLLSVPAELDFGTVAVSGHPQLVDRLVTDWKIEIMDTRATGNWTLNAKADPLTSLDGSNTLPDALVFVQPNGTIVPLATGSAVEIAQRQPAATPGTMEVAWTQNRGLHLNLKSFEGTNGQAYATTITWTLELN